MRRSPTRFLMRGPIGAFLLFYVIMSTVPCGLGLSLVFAPTRAGNFLNEVFALFPEVRRGEWTKRVLYQVFGVGLIAVSVFYGLQLWRTIIGSG